MSKNLKKIKLKFDKNLLYIYKYKCVKIINWFLVEIVLHIYNIIQMLNTLVIVL